MFEPIFKIALVNVVAAVHRELAFAVLLVVPEAPFVHATVNVVEAPLALYVSLLELAGVGALINDVEGALAFEAAVLELALVVVAVGEGVLGVLALKLVVDPDALVDVAVCEVHAAVAVLFTVGELAVEAVSDGCGGLDVALQFIVYPVASNLITVSKGEHSFTMPPVIVPHSLIL